MKIARNFSIVIATYSGVETIDGLFDSLLRQTTPPVKYEMVVVVDGPNPQLLQKVEKAKVRFEDKGIDFRIIRHLVNKGRFEARLAGALAAKFDFLLIVDDRVTLPKDYLKMMASSSQAAIMPDVIEKSAPNFISLTLNKLRGRIYGKKWGQDFGPFYINKQNFDDSPKGTTSLWVPKGAFIDACRKISHLGRMTKNISDDTKILWNIIVSGLEIYKTSKIRIEYQPRSSSAEELKHIFHRAPKFIDYYFQLGTKYFWPILIFYLSIIPLVILLVIFPIIWLGILIISIILSILLGGISIESARIIVGLWCVGAVFCVGLIVGLLRKLVRL